MATLALIATQLVGTLTLRPYVFGFLAFFLVAATRDFGRRRALLFLFWGWGVALAAELASTHIGIPFGLYHYTGETRGAELFLWNVPFFSPPSFPFLAYASFSLARMTFGPAWAATPRGRARTVAVAGALMMLLDVVIDPLAVRGDHWFLGHIFSYPDGGIYFGVPLSNFLGWLLVGLVTVGGLVWAGESGSRPPVLGVVLYYAVLVANLGLTVGIGEWLIAGVGIVVHTTVFLLLYIVSRVVVGRWSAQPLSVSATSGGGSAS